MSVAFAMLRLASAAAMSAPRTLRPPTARWVLPSRAPMVSMSSLGGPEIVVLGGGFGGLFTALRLRSLDWSGGPRPRITLVDRDERFCFSPMLYELATGTATTWEVAPLYEELLDGTEISFVRGEITGLDDDTGVVRVSTGDATLGGERMVPYDQCVLALGAQPSYFGVPGASSFAQPFYTADDALAVKERVRALRQRRADAEGTDGVVGGGAPLRVGVVGGGYIGVEIAANLASALPEEELLLTLIHRSDGLLPSGADFSRAEAVRRLRDEGVDIVLNTEVTEVHSDRLSLRPLAFGLFPLALPG